jgi:tetratricopeptide (TPR) repeat protein
MNENETWFSKYGKWVCLFLSFLIGLSFAFMLCKALGTQASLTSQAKVTLLVGIGIFALQFCTALDWILYKAEKHIVEGRYPEALKIIQNVMLFYSILRPTAPDRARLLVLLGGCHLASGNQTAARGALTEAVDMIKHIKESALWVVGSDSILAEQLNQVFDQRFRGIEGVANLELAGIYQTQGRHSEAVSLCRGSIDSLQEYRSDIVRQMTRQEVSKKKEYNGDRWALLSRAASKAEKLAAIEVCLEGAYNLSRSLQRV